MENTKLFSYKANIEESSIELVATLLYGYQEFLDGPEYVVEHETQVPVIDPETNTPTGEFTTWRNIEYKKDKIPNPQTVYEFLYDKYEQLIDNLVKSDYSKASKMRLDQYLSWQKVVTKDIPTS